MLSARQQTLEALRAQIRELLTAADACGSSGPLAGAAAALEDEPDAAAAAAAAQPDAAAAATWDDVIVALRVPYCETHMNWHLVVSAAAAAAAAAQSQSAAAAAAAAPPPDLLLLGDDAQLGGTHAARAAAAGELLQELHGGVRLVQLRALAAWRADDRSALAALCLDLRAAHRRHQLARLRRCPIASAAATLPDVERCGDCEVLVGGAGCGGGADGFVRLTLPLTALRGDAEEPAAANGPLAGRLAAQMSLRIEFAGRGGRVDVTARFPAEMAATRAAYKPPPWASAGGGGAAAAAAAAALPEYMAAARGALVAPWARRRALIMALAARSGMLEYDAADFGAAHFCVQALAARSGMREFDAADFGAAHVCVQVKPEGASATPVSRVIRVALPPAFPEEAPALAAVDLLSAKRWPIDTRGLKYSPRWPPERVAAELFAHVCRELPHQTER